jgi:hypothetical protein
VNGSNPNPATYVDFAAIKRFQMRITTADLKAAVDWCETYERYYVSAATTRTVTYPAGTPT